MWGAGHVTAGGKRLEYRCWGDAPEDGRCVVLLHEGLGCVALWKGFPAALHEALGLPVIAYSRAGYGGSEADDLPRPLDWMTREAEVLPEVLEALGIGAPVLIGHSDGATIAAIAAGQPLLRQGVLAVVLIAPHFFTEDMGLTQIAKANAGFEASGLRERMANYHQDADATFRGWADAWLSDGFRDWNVEAALDGICAPVLVIQGREDQYGTLAQVEAVTARCRTAQAPIVDDCKHVPHLEQPDLVLAEVVKFVHYNAN
ncbi:alpha/beta fold hydrolase [Jannaschia sp. CCS1]|uniref:alpha/beta fold hydrolase n=1 Tax=Jannaschia sp. (strain CCS1) TaxID=290400 RepID=UPI00006BFF91|nr:alpha/beta hydrolase [Jannaschia sp. CCS1]ABD53587.1 alpha/beta hydrolase [Jannaschia sp. CCS1]